MKVQKIGYIFPGQGAQFVGMGKSVYDANSVSRQIFEKANEVLGFDLASLCFNGPEEELMRTKYSQPAIFTVSIAALECLQQNFPELKPSFSFGLSLGEYSALVAAGALSFEEGLKLVKVRGEAMEDAASNTEGTMASVLGMDYEVCKSTCDTLGGVWIANLNSPGQIVISGTVSGIDQAILILKEKGAKRVIPLKVGGAFHSELMVSAKERLESAVKEAKIIEPNCYFISNYTAALENSVEKIKKNLLQQLTGTVRWSESFAFAVGEGMTKYLEIGPGNVLKGLAKKIDRTAEVSSIETVEQIEGLKEVLV